MNSNKFFEEGDIFIHLPDDEQDPVERIMALMNFRNGWEDIPRAPAGSSNGGQWVAEGAGEKLLLAPNGKPSNLSSDLYKIVRSKEFKDWFGDWENDPENASKVLDENGEPKVVWHGSDVDFNVFDEKFTNPILRGFYFAWNKKYSEGLPHKETKVVKPYFLNLRTPGTYDDNDRLIPKNADGVMIPGLQVNIFDNKNIKLADGKNKKFGKTADVRDIYNFREGVVPRKPKGDPEGGQWTSEWLTEGPDFEAKKKEMRIPPAWTEVRINSDPEEDLQATGFDSKGRKQYVYSQTATMRQAALKFAKIEELMQKANEIEAQNNRNLKSKDPYTAECAAVMALIFSTGIRPGSTADTGAEKQAYGATTLEARHVVLTANGGVRLQFVGKKGVQISIPVKDPEVAAILKDRKAAAGGKWKTRIFDVSDGQLRNYVKTLDGGDFNPKDFRTLKGTETAIAEIKAQKFKRARSEKAYKKMVKTVAKKVAAVLGNTPAVALKSYINPFVFTQLKP